MQDECNNLDTLHNETGLRKIIYLSEKNKLEADCSACCLRSHAKFGFRF